MHFIFGYIYGGDGPFMYRVRRGLRDRKTKVGPFIFIMGFSKQLFSISWRKQARNQINANSDRYQQNAIIFFFSRSIRSILAHSLPSCLLCGFYAFIKKWLPNQAICIGTTSFTGFELAFDIHKSCINFVNSTHCISKIHFIVCFGCGRRCLVTREKKKKGFFVARLYPFNPQHKQIQTKYVNTAFFFPGAISTSVTKVLMRWRSKKTKDCV